MNSGRSLSLKRQLVSNERVCSTLEGDGARFGKLSDTVPLAVFVVW